MDNRWVVEVQLDEDGTRTAATAMLSGANAPSLVDRGYSRRHPDDRPINRVGEELAVARALVSLANELLEKATAEIEESTHQRAHLKA